MRMTEQGIALRASQRKMILPGETTLQAMMDITAARARLPGHDEDDVLNLIEVEEALPWAWNIAASTGAATKSNKRGGRLVSREVRILTRCVDHYAVAGKALKLTWKQALAEIFHGCDKPFLTAKQVRLILNCSSSHVTNLLEAGLLQTLPGTYWSTGPSGSALITCDSFVGFLSERSLNPIEV